MNKPGHDSKVSNIEGFAVRVLPSSCYRTGGDWTQRIGRRLTAIAFLLASASAAYAQATVSSTEAISNIPRAGVDVNVANYYSSQTQANYFSNPGFEWPQFAQAIGVASVSGSPINSFTAINKLGAGAEPANFWTGTNICSVRVGTCSDGTNNYFIPLPVCSKEANPWDRATPAMCLYPINS
jgi:hypothetical protein